MKKGANSERALIEEGASQGANYHRQSTTQRTRNAYHTHSNSNVRNKNSLCYKRECSLKTNLKNTVEVAFQSYLPNRISSFFLLVRTLKK